MKNRVNPITEKQQEVLDFVKAYMADHGFAPAVEEIAGHFAIQRNAAICRLMGLEKKKYISRIPNVARSIVIVERP